MSRRTQPTPRHGVIPHLGARSAVRQPLSTCDTATRSTQIRNGLTRRPSVSRGSCAVKSAALGLLVAIPREFWLFDARYVCRRRIWLPRGRAGGEQRDNSVKRPWLGTIFAQKSFWAGDFPRTAPTSVRRTTSRYTTAYTTATPNHRSSQSPSTSPARKSHKPRYWSACASRYNRSASRAQ